MAEGAQDESRLRRLCPPLVDGYRRGVEHRPVGFLSRLGDGEPASPAFTAAKKQRRAHERVAVEAMELKILERGERQPAVWTREGGKPIWSPRAGERSA